MLNFIRERMPDFFSGETLHYTSILYNTVDISRSEVFNVFKWAYEGLKNAKFFIDSLDCTYDIIMFLENEMRNGTCLFTKDILHPIYYDAEACRYMLQNGYRFGDILPRSGTEKYYNVEVIQILNEFEIRFNKNLQLCNAALVRDVDVLQFMFENSLWDEESVIDALIVGGHTDLLNYFAGKRMVKVPIDMSTLDSFMCLKKWKVYEWLISHGAKVDRDYKRNALMRPTVIKETDAQNIEFWMSEDGCMSMEERRKAMRAGQGPELIKNYLEYLKRSETP